MAFVEWGGVESGKKKGSFGARKGEGSAGKFLKLEANSKYTLRPVHRPVVFFKLNHDGPNGFRSAIVADPDSSTVVATHPEVRIAKRYAILVIDRSTNALKILEGPVSIFEHFKKYYDIVKLEPGGKDGGDFEITVVCENGKKDRNTTYEVNFVGKSPFTEEEKKMIMDSKDQFDLNEIFKPLSDEEIEKVLFSEELPARASQSAPARTAAAPARTAAPATVAARPAAPATVVTTAPAAAPQAGSEDEWFKF